MKKLNILQVSFFFLFSLFTQAFAQQANQDEGTLSPKMVNFTAEATSIDLENAQLSLAQVNQSIKNIKQNLRDYREQMEALVITPSDTTQQARIDFLHSKIQNQQNFLHLTQLRQLTLEKTIAALKTQLQIEQQTLENLAETQQRETHIEHEKQLQASIEQLANEQNYWLNQIDSLNQLLHDHKQNAQNYTSVLQQIFIAEESSNITQFKISLLHIDNSLRNISTNISEAASSAELSEQKNALTDNLNDLEQTQNILEKKIDLLKQREDLLNHHSQGNGTQPSTAITQIESFMAQYQDLLQNVKTLTAQASHEDDKTTALLAKALARRQGLPGFNTHDWIMLGHGLTQTIILSYQVSIASLHDIYLNSNQLDTAKTIEISILIFLSIIAYGIFRVGIRSLRKKLSSTQNILYQFLDNALRVFAAHLWYITLFLASMVFLNIINIASQVTDIIFHAGSTILIYSVSMMIARLALYQNRTSQTGDDVKLYHRLCWLFSFGFIIAFFMMLSKSLNSSYVAQDLFERLFMGFTFIVGILLLKAWKVLPDIIIPFIQPPKNYLIRATRLLGLVFPLIILSNAILGLIGFVELAWTISRYEGLFVLIVIAYLILRGLMNDGLAFLAVSAIRLRSGWIITQAFLKPISIWLHIFLFFLSVYFLLYLYGITHQPLFVNAFYKSLNFPLIKISNQEISLLLIIKATIVGSIFIWITKWTREFCYRKLYRNIQDKGIRNSLAIFTQYGVCTLGIIITLGIIHINLTTLMYAVSALLLGIGFGLRDLANNFVSGLLILIERPMRRGDTVTIGEYEGTVLSIGMRAISILSGDNREILVPNSEVFSKTFINWTHHDDVVRCDTTIKVRWQEDPHQLKVVIEDIMRKTDGILSKPAPDAILKGMNDGLLEFELRFYIDYRINDSRMTMKSKVLFSIWDKFVELGIQPPYPTQRVFNETVAANPQK